MVPLNVKKETTLERKNSTATQAAKIQQLDTDVRDEVLVNRLVKPSQQISVVG